MIAFDVSFSDFSCIPTAIMPLDTIEDPFELSSYESVKQTFVIFYASRDDNGKMWCPVSGPTIVVAVLLLGRNTSIRPVLAPKRGRVPNGPTHTPVVFNQPSSHILIRRYRRHQDCRNVEELIKRTFAPADGPTGLIVYVGQLTECVDGYSLPPSRSASKSKKVVLKKNEPTYSFDVVLSCPPPFFFCIMNMPRPRHFCSPSS